DHEKTPGHELAMVRHARGDGEERVALGSTRARQLQVRDARRAACSHELKGVRHGIVLAFRLARWNPSSPPGCEASRQRQSPCNRPETGGKMPSMPVIRTAVR